MIAVAVVNSPAVLSIQFANFELTISSSPGNFRDISLCSKINGSRCESGAVPPL
jgi:hypothetical protein